MSSPAKDRLKQNIRRERDRLIASRADLHRRLGLVEAQLAALHRIDPPHRKNNRAPKSK